MKTLVILPSRMASSRLPDKPMALIEGTPMIVHVYRRAAAAGFETWVAAGDPVIAETIHALGGKAILTDPALPAGSDRVAAAAALIDPDKSYDCVVNVQGDLPLLQPTMVTQAAAVLKNIKEADIATLAAPFESEEEAQTEANVKIAAGFNPGQTVAQALYFSRNIIPCGGRPLYHHVGLYAFRREALDRYVTWPQTLLEQQERLEQLRALEHGLKIYVGLTDEVPTGVDTPDDLDRMRQHFKNHGDPFAPQKP